MYLYIHALPPFVVIGNAVGVGASNSSAMVPSANTSSLLSHMSRSSAKRHSTGGSMLLPTRVDTMKFNNSGISATRQDHNDTDIDQYKYPLLHGDVQMESTAREQAKKVTCHFHACIFISCLFIHIFALLINALYICSNWSEG